MAFISQNAANWRETLRRNNQRALWVMALFVLIYCALGLLIDVAIYSEQFPQVSISHIFLALVTLQLFPLATVVMLGIAAVSLFVTLTFNNKLMLLGTEYREITPSTAQTMAETQLYNTVEELK